MSDVAVSFLDTTLRDGAQSLWASGIRHGMMAAVAEELDHAGFTHIELPVNPIFFKKMVRDLKENPWDIMRMLAQRITRTPTACMYSAYQNLNTFGTPTPPVLGELYTSLMADIGVLDRAQLTANTADQLTRTFPREVPYLKGLGMEIALALAYTESPRHTDEYYAQKARQAAAFQPDAIYLKDQGGLLTPERLKTLLPVILAEAGDIPVEVHSHCTTGLAPLVYLEALELGVRTLHTGIPPLANGSAQPSVLEVAANARALGYTTDIDEERVRAVSGMLRQFARRDGLPEGQTTPYSAAQFQHQIPGGVISNLTFQLAEIGIEDRLDEVLEECIRIRHELGYPIMITPYSQYVCTQAAVNVATGERYGNVIDPIIRLAQGDFGEDSGYLWMDENLRDDFLSRPRAKELAQHVARPLDDVTLSEAREMYGHPGISDEDLVLRAIVQSTTAIDDMYRAGPPASYSAESRPSMVSLLESIAEHPRLNYISIRKNNDVVTVSKTQ
ncbi:MAG TPA: hypothetical protein VK024_03855 [Actinomycetaceae bacterium]|nr:hypothetical protein [Actinomycetaceae bacterium]